MIDLTAKESVFTFDNRLYKEDDCVAMGSVLGPTLANAFLCDFEIKEVDSCSLDFKPLMYKRYVEDFLLVFKDHVELFLKYLNNKDENKFHLRSWKERPVTLLELDVYREEIFTTLGQSHIYFVPHTYKQS